MEQKEPMEQQAAEGIRSQPQAQTAGEEPEGKEQPLTQEERMRKILKGWVLPFGIEILVLLFVIKVLFFFVLVPSGSMIPTIDEASVLFATRVHDPATLQRGDIVVFQSDELGLTLVKRLIGLPGDTVTLDKDGKLSINGERVEEPYVFYKAAVSGKFQVPEGHYLFLGDNRSGSNDARMWKQPYISGEKICGKAQFTIWPVANFGKLYQ